MSIAFVGMRSNVFVNAWVGAGNLGDELLFERLCHRLRHHGVEQITTVSLNPEDTTRRHRGVNALTPRQLFRSARAIRAADLLIVGPGGILQDDTSPWSLPYQLHRPMLARLVGTPVTGYGLGAGPLRRRPSTWLLRLGLGSTAPLLVRDDDSAELLTTRGLTAIATADLVVATPTPRVEPADRIVVCLRPHTPGGGFLPVRWQRDTWDTERISAIATALDNAATANRLTTAFVAFEPHRDQPLHEAVAARMTTPTETLTPDSDTLLAEVARSRLVVATRFHAGIAALVGHRPAVLVGYAPKVRTLAARLSGMYPLIADSSEGFTNLPRAIEQALAVEPSRIEAELTSLRADEAINDRYLEQALHAGDEPEQ